ADRREVRARREDRVRGERCPAVERERGAAAGGADVREQAVAGVADVGGVRRPRAVGGAGGPGGPQRPTAPPGGTRRGGGGGGVVPRPLKETVTLRVKVSPMPSDTGAPNGAK